MMHSVADELFSYQLKKAVKELVERYGERFSADVIWDDYAQEFGQQIMNQASEMLDFDELVERCQDE